MARKGENIYRRRDGRWEGRWISSYDKYGKAKYSSIYGKSYSEVKARLIECKSTCVIKNKHKSDRTLNECTEDWYKKISLFCKESTLVKSLSTT